MLAAVRRWFKRRKQRRLLRVLQERAARAIVILEEHPERWPGKGRPDPKALEADPNIEVEEW